MLHHAVLLCLQAFCVAFLLRDRRGGRDHIWLVTHDEASCWVPAAIRSSIILSHWGRMDANHSSDTGYFEDNYRQARLELGVSCWPTDCSHAAFLPVLQPRNQASTGKP